MVASKGSIRENEFVNLQQDCRSLREQCGRLIIENDRLRKDNIRLNLERIGIIQRHGAATFLLQKFTRRWCVRVFCRALRREAEEHLNPTAQ